MGVAKLRFTAMIDGRCHFSTHKAENPSIVKRKIHCACRIGHASDGRETVLERLTVDTLSAVRTAHSHEDDDEPAYRVLERCHDVHVSCSPPVFFDQ